MGHWLALALAIVAETAATTALKATQEFTRLGPSLIVVGGYALAFYCMTISLRALPIGVMYAIWSGCGIVLVSVVGWLFYRQTLDLPAVIGIALIITGVVVMQLFSTSVPR